MSTISDDARVQLFMADYAAIDASNKINALGVGFQITVVQPSGHTAPQTVVVLLEVPTKHVGEDCTFELKLLDSAGDVVGAPGPTGDLMPLRFGQSITLEQPAFTLPGLRFPREAVRTRNQLVANFQMGLPLAVGQSYEWRVFIDTVSKPDWAISFYVPGPAGSLVVG